MIILLIIASNIYEYVHLQILYYFILCYFLHRWICQCWDWTRTLSTLSYIFSSIYIYLIIYLFIYYFFNLFSVSFVIEYLFCYLLCTVFCQYIFHLFSIITFSLLSHFFSFSFFSSFPLFSVFFRWWQLENFCLFRYFAISCVS